ncbi:MAG: hypothetical protein WBF43_07685, partial [Methylocella sp.]
GGPWARGFPLSPLPQACRRADFGELFHCGAGLTFGISRQASWPMKDRMGPGMVSPDLDPRLDTARAQRAGGDLPFRSVERHAIIVAGAAFFRNAENLAKIDARDGNESRALQFGLDREARIVGRNIESPMKALAASIVAVPASASASVRRSCRLGRTR